MALFEYKQKEEDKKYSKITRIPQYEITGTKPQIAELYNSKKYSELMYKINNSSVSSEEKEFLKKAATRHIIFNYAQIAEYYAQASKEMQELMEESALVLIDIDDAIANGYLKLSKTINNIIQESKKENN